MGIFTFDRFFTPAYIKIIFILGIVLIVLGMLAGIIAGFTMMNYSAGTGIAAVFGSIVGSVIVFVFWRVSCEAIMVFFRMHDELRAIRTGGDIEDEAATISPEKSESPKPSWRTE